MQQNSRYGNDFFEQLKKNGINVSKEQQKQINFRLQSILNYEPRVGIFGKTGVGKSSLCNSLFGKDICAISDVEACTRNPQEVFLEMGSQNTGIKLVDVPGVGESSLRDEEYAKLYTSLLPELDLVLWLIKADDRAMASDENFYKNIVKPHIEEGKPFFFVLNQVDKIEPFREWDEAKSEPGPKQFQNIHRKIDDLARFFDVAPSKVIPVSANEKYNLTKLVDEFIRALPSEKKITMFRAVDDEFQSKATGEHVKKSFLEVVGEVVAKTVDRAADVVISVVETVGDVITSGVEKVGDWIDDHLSFGGGGGCFITTAVCKNNNRNDDCYELTQFRDFRDSWLIKQHDGNELIEEYYKIAPTIVNNINKSSKKSEIYKKIEVEHLNYCLRLIENKEYFECKKAYSKMVAELKKEYF